MRHPDRIYLQFLLAVLPLCSSLGGCAMAEPEVDACRAAADVVEECTGVVAPPPAECAGEEEAQARAILEGGCDVLGAGGTKADGSNFCPQWLGMVGLCNIA